MKKKVWVLVSILLIITVAVAGCGSPTDEAAEPQTDGTEQAEASEAEQETEQADATQPEQEAEVAVVAQPEGFPEKNIEFLLPIPAGGLIDVAMRKLGDIVDFGVPVVVVNRPGASQTIGLTEVNQKSDDPYIVTAAGFAGFMIQPNMMELPYSIDDFRYIGIHHPPEPLLIVSSADSKYQTWQDVLDALNAGEEVSYSATNPNGSGRVALLEVTSQEDIEPKFVPFTGSAEGFAALLGGHIDFYIVDASVAVPKILDKQMTGLMVVGSDRLTKVPDVPSAHELGLEGMEKFVGYSLIAVSKGTPDEIVDWIKFKIDEAQQSDAYVEYLNTVVGAENPLELYTEEEVTEMVYNTYEAFTAIMEKYGLTE